MITLTNWLITNNIMTADVVMYHMPERVIKAQFNIKTEEFKVCDNLEEVDRAYIKKALITVYKV